MIGGLHVVAWLALVAVIVVAVVVPFTVVLIVLVILLTVRIVVEILVLLICKEIRAKVVVGLVLFNYISSRLLHFELKGVFESLSEHLGRLLNGYSCYCLLYRCGCCYLWICGLAHWVNECAVELYPSWALLHFLNICNLLVDKGIQHVFRVVFYLFLEF